MGVEVTDEVVLYRLAAATAALTYASGCSWDTPADKMFFDNQVKEIKCLMKRIRG